MSKTKLTITLDPGVIDKLPRTNKSYAINSILIKHFQDEGVDKLYEHIAKKFLKDERLSEYVYNAVQGNLRNIGYSEWGSGKHKYGSAPPAINTSGRGMDTRVLAGELTQW